MSVGPEMKTIYIEDNDGIYSAYADKHDPYVCGRLIEATIDAGMAKLLCEATKYYNQSQDLLRQLSH